MASASRLLPSFSLSDFIIVFKSQKVNRSKRKNIFFLKEIIDIIEDAADGFTEATAGKIFAVLNI